MAYPDANTLDPTNATRMRNEPAEITASSMKRKAWITGTFDPSKTLVVEDTPKEYFSAEAVGDELGWGFPLHLGAKRFFKYGQGVSFWVTPQAEPGGATAATKTVTVSVTTVVAGTLHMFFAGYPLDVILTDGMTDEEVATAIAAAVNADQSNPYTASSTLAVVTLTAKAKGTYGNGLTVAANLYAGQEYPDGVSIAIADGVAGSGDPDISDALDGLGTGDDRNEQFWTDAAHATPLVSADATKIINYVGKTDEAIGCWASVVARPMRFVSYSTEAGDAGYTAMKVISDAQVYNRAVCYIGAPDAYDHPFDLACETLGYVAAVNQANAHRSYVGAKIDAICGSDRWTKDGANRDAAMHAGISTTRYSNNVLKLNGLVTMSRPPSIPVKNNAYRSFRNISLAQNMMKSNQEYNDVTPSFTIVSDVATVKPSEKPYVRDIESKEDQNAEMVDSWGQNAWLYDASHSIQNQVVTVREDGSGFDSSIPVIFSGEGTISNTTLLADISLTTFSG